ncbi:MAG TPA: valine--tRNA ligase [Candidatus Babeliales bacterium]|jgi:valyl-tRNA synthetase|nr:valine--tRNA ligase [Candidatus Babeliales bacterium]
MEKRYDHQLCEAAAQQQWETNKTYAMENNPGPLFSIDTPPPTVSGTLHIGHIFSYTQTDIIARYKRMNGYSVFYPFGFDDNGLPTERYVEKKRNVRGHEVSRSEFIALCIQESHEAADTFKKLWQKMGLSADWSETYSTISDDSRRISQASFIELFNKDYIYRKQEPALYCTTCRTSVAQAELDDQELASSFNDILFKDSDGNDLTIATTRPELLPACVAVLYNPADIRYTHLHGKKAIVPLFGQSVPLLPDELVSIEKGSGLVMVCTFGDKTDIIWYKKHNLPYHHVIGLDGKCTDNAGFLQGLKVVDARAAVIEKLREKNLLLRQQAISHSVSVHERCKKEIEFTILPQWFIAILPYKEKFLEMANSIDWYPTFMKSRYNDWVENLAWDWGISRQRFYGIPFPAWHCQDCGKILLADLNQLPVDPQETPYNGPCSSCGSSNIKPDTDVMDTWNTSSLTPYICFDVFQKINSLSFVSFDRLRTNGENKTNNGEEINSLSSASPSPSAPSASSSPSFLSASPSPFVLSLSKDTNEVKDTNETLEFIPMSMRPQAHDIIRTWAFDTIVKAWMHNGIAPWKSIVISGHVLSDSKEKLSKSKSNASTMDPIMLLQRYPADAIRYWTASGRLGQDMMFSEEQLTIGQKLITKLWNAFRFAEPHLIDFTTPHTSPENLDTVNRWLLHTISACFEKYQNYFEQQEFGLALDTIEQFFWNDFCDNYVELVKNQLFNPEQYSSQQVDATRWTLYHAGLRILQLYAPYLPHATETLYQELYKKHEPIGSIHQTRYQDIQILYNFASEAEIMHSIITLVTQIRKLKSEQQLSLKTPLTTMNIFTPMNSPLREAIAQHDQLIRGITQAVTVVYQEYTDQSSNLIEKDGEWHANVVLEE